MTDWTDKDTIYLKLSFDTDINRNPTPPYMNW